MGKSKAPLLARKNRARNGAPGVGHPTRIRVLRSGSRTCESLPAPLLADLVAGSGDNCPTLALPPRPPPAVLSLPPAPLFRTDRPRLESTAPGRQFAADILRCSSCEIPDGARSRYIPRKFSPDRDDGAPASPANLWTRIALSPRRCWPRSIPRRTHAAPTAPGRAHDRALRRK